MANESQCEQTESQLSPAIHYRVRHWNRKPVHFSVQINENLHWRKHIKATTAKANKTSAFSERNLKGSAATVQYHYLKIVARPILECSSEVWDPHYMKL